MQKIQMTAIEQLKAEGYYVVGIEQTEKSTLLKRI